MNSQLQEEFKPPYCSNPECPWHQPTPDFRYKKWGSYPINRFPFVSRRYLCLRCGTSFTDSFFDLNYRDRQNDTYEEILRLKNKGSSRRDIALHVHQSLDVVQRRIGKLTRQGLLLLAKDQEKLTIQESIAYDGVENFSFSQFDPNNLNHAVGRESLYTYDFNFCHLNRKGAMSERQKKKKQELERKHGRYPGRAIEACSERLFVRLLSQSGGPLELYTDNHFLYRSAIAKVKDKDKIAHFITSSKVTRNYRNPLFAVNHLDSLTRHRLADFKRETIAFAKHSIGMMESFVLMAVEKNYMRPKFVKTQKRDPRANKASPAMYLGLRSHLQSFTDLFRTRITKAQVKLNEDWLLFFERRDPYSRRPIRPYCGI